MKNIFKNIIALLILGIVIFIFRDSIKKSYYILQDKYFPCTRVITYSLGNVDPLFGISREDFLSAISVGEDMWETSINKKLFEYIPNGGELTINLIYDKRQKNTQILKEISSSLENNQSSYNILKNQVDSLKKEFEYKKSIFESRINVLKDAQGRYTKENITEINLLQDELNVYVRKINSLVNELNKSGNSINNQSKEYNNVGDELGEQFEEGLYHSDKFGKYIDIYQFENKNKLERVLMHELGHSLSINHIDNKEAIMYQLNTGTNLIPTQDDINELRIYCKLNKM